MAHSESVFTVQATIYLSPHQLETLAAVVSPAPVRVKNQEHLRALLSSIITISANIPHHTI